MKKRDATLLAIAMLVAGTAIGFQWASQVWKGVQEDSLVASALHDVSTSYRPLWFLADGNTNEALHILESNLENALVSIELCAKELDRADILTNSVVIKANQHSALSSSR